MRASASGAFDLEQWQLLRTHHEGFWKAVWISCGPDGEELDSLEADSAWVMTKKEEMIQMNTYFVGVVRSSCEVCQDSVEGRQLQVGSYSPGQMPALRLAGRGLSFGPRVTKRGMLTAELGLRDGVSRVRVLFAYEPRYAPSGGGPPTSLDLTRITLMREALDRPPLKEEPREISLARPSGVAADFWRRNEGAPLLGLWKGLRHSFPALSSTAAEPREEEAESLIAVEPVGPTHLRACRCTTGKSGDELELDAGLAVLHLPGGIDVACPRALSPGCYSELSVSWQPEGTEPRLLRATLGLTALGRVVTENESEVVMTPPTCDGFVFEELEQLAPALA